MPALDRCRLDGAPATNRTLAKPDKKYRPRVPMGGTQMTTGHIAAFFHRRLRVGLGAVLLTAPFVAGLATGLNTPGAVARDPSRSGSLQSGVDTRMSDPASQGPFACSGGPVMVVTSELLAWM